MKRFGAFTVLAVILMLIAGLSAAPAQKTSDPKYQLSGNGMIQVSPADLGVNALTEPGSGTTALSSIVDTTGARAATLKFSCTQGAVTVNVQTYAEDRTTALTLGAPVSAVAAATNADLYIATEQDIQSTTGTISTTFKLRLPQKAIAFSFTNASASAGTCTARLFQVY
jgi:hypothetical protein